MSVSCMLVSCLRNRSSVTYLSISPLHITFRLPHLHSRKPVSTAWYGWATRFHRWLNSPPAHPLNPINPDNARILRITAAAGTELADAYSSDTCNKWHVTHFTLEQKKFTIHRTVFLHATWLVQTSVHWPIFLTAASRRSLDRVSVPMWGTSLSGPLMIVGLVGLYPTNYLIISMPNLYPHVSNSEDAPQAHIKY